MSVMMVPEGWEVKTVAQACDILDNQRIPLNDEERQTMKGHIPYYGANAIVDYIDSYLFDEDLILLAEDGGNFDDYENRQIAYKITGKSWVNNHAHIVRPKKKFDFDFIFYSLQHKNITSFIRGGTRSKLNQSDLKAVELLAPISYSEQQKIASILSTLDRTIEATQKLIDKEKMVKKGLMADLLTHGIDEQGRIRSPQTHTYVDSPLGMIPEGWNTTTLGDTAIFNAGYAFKNHELSEFGLKVVRISNLHKSSFPYWHYDGKIKKTWIVDKGDLLFSWAGVANSIDCVKYEGELALLNQHIFNLKIKDPVLKEFTFQYLQFHLPRLREEIEGGAGQLHLTKSKIESICIPDMKLSEKKKIVELFTAQDRKIETEETNLAKLQNLKKGLMGDLLSGKVRVKV